MPLTILCGCCGKTLAIPDHALGKKLACPFCKAVVTPPAEEHVPEIADIQVVDEDEEAAGGTYAFDPAEKAEDPQGRHRARVATEVGVLSLGSRAAPASCLAISSDNRIGLAGSAETIFVLGLRDWKKLHRFEKQEAVVTCVAISPDGKLALSGDDRGGLLLWELHTGRPLRWLEGHKGALNALAFAPNGRYAVSGGDDGSTRLWELQSGREFELFGSRWDTPVRCVAYASDGRQLLATGGGGRVRTWSVKTGEPLKKFKGASGEVASAAFSKEGREIVACTPARMTKTGLKVWKWSAETGKALPVFDSPASNRASVTLAVVVPGALRIMTAGRKGSGNRQGVSGGDVAVSVIGSVVGTLALRALGGGDGVVIVGPGAGEEPGPEEDPYCLQLWNVAAGLISNTYEAGDEPAGVLAVSPDASRALSACRDNTVHAWGLPM